MNNLMDDLKGDAIENVVEDLVTKICLEETKKEEKEDECLSVHVEQILGDAISLALEDFVDEEQARAKEAEALLGGCLDLVCTYPEGYKPRQPLYSCKTCSSLNDNKLAGICYACSENCHEGHDLVELYTKRNFCCDCGNSKFLKSTKCKLYEEKDPVNSRNNYNDNFKGIFCFCKKPYPPEVEDVQADTNEDVFEDMVQCQVCEDWYHPSHSISNLTERCKLDREREDDEDGGYCLICFNCIKRLPWLEFYANKIDNVENGCKLEMLKSLNEEKKDNNNNDGLCFPINWRDQLCRCKECKALYEDLECQFLLDPEDTLEYFEKQNREHMNTKKDESCKINKKQVEDVQLQRELALKMRSGIEQMKRHCVTFFAKRSADKCLNNSAVITKEDVADCFHELMIKRQKLMLEENENDLKECSWTE